jgi:hypothetical protein
MHGANMKNVFCIWGIPGKIFPSNRSDLLGVFVNVLSTTGHMLGSEVQEAWRAGNHGPKNITVKPTICRA